MFSSFHNFFLSLPPLHFNWIHVLYCLSFYLKLNTATYNLFWLPEINRWGNGPAYPTSTFSFPSPSGTVLSDHLFYPVRGMLFKICPEIRVPGDVLDFTSLNRVKTYHLSFCHNFSIYHLFGWHSSSNSMFKKAHGNYILWAFAYLHFL